MHSPNNWRLIATVCFLVLAVAGSANAEKIIKTCATVEVRSIAISYEFVRDAPLDKKWETIENGLSAVETKDITVVAHGPVLGSMDSAKISSDIACTKDGFVIAATITRSANYHGAVRRNVLWSPKIRTVVVLRQPEIILQMTWKMHLDNGQSLDSARTPPFLERKYPITVTKTLHSTSSRSQ